MTTKLRKLLAACKGALHKRTACSSVWNLACLIPLYFCSLFTLLTFNNRVTDCFVLFPRRSTSVTILGLRLELVENGKHMLWSKWKRTGDDTVLPLELAQRCVRASFFLDASEELLILK